MQHPPVKGAAPPGTYFGTLRSVGLRKTTDVLEFSRKLMEQRTLDARGVLYCRFFYVYFWRKKVYFREKSAIKFTKLRERRSGGF